MGLDRDLEVLLWTGRQHVPCAETTCFLTMSSERTTRVLLFGLGS